MVPACRPILVGNRDYAAMASRIVEAIHYLVSKSPAA